MKPVNFNYVKEKKQLDFPEIKYDNNLNLSLLDGEIFVRDNNDSTIEMSKTFSDREQDDEINNSVIYTTKTNTQRESDDEAPRNNFISRKVFYLSKTEVKREQDDE